MMHMAWANQAIFNEIAKLPDNALEAYVTNEEWPVAVILLHIVKASDGYGCRLNGNNFGSFDFPETMSDIKKLAEMLKEFDAELLNLSTEPDRVIEVNREGKITHWQASTILSQSIHHATEHRAQAVAALEFRGFKAPSLDDYDLWAYEFSTK